MAGNALARKALLQAQGRGEEPEDVYAAVADSIEGVDRYQRAWCLGYLARLVDRPRERNPHDPEDGEDGVKLYRKWADGWTEGGTGDFQALADRVREFDRQRSARGK